MFSNALRQSKLATSTCRSFSSAALPASATRMASRNRPLLSSQVPPSRFQSTAASRSYATTTTTTKPRKPENPPSNVLMLLGMDKSTSVEDVKALVGQFEPSDVKLMVPTTHQVAYIDFPDPSVAEKALQEVKSREGVKDVHQIFSKVHNAQVTVMIVGDVNVRELHNELRDYKPGRYMIRSKKNPYGVVEFADVESATKAREALAGKGDFKAVFGVPREENASL